MDWPESRDFGAPPDDVAHAQEAPPYNELAEDEGVALCLLMGPVAL